MDSPTPSGKPPERPAFPELPVVTLSTAERLTVTQKYGALFYLAVAGLVILILVIGLFLYQLWALREVWGHVYVLHDAREPEVARLEAARAFTSHPEVTPRQILELSLSKDLPPSVRFVLAEALTPEAIAHNPIDHAKRIAAEADWPNWLRILELRPLAYAAGGGEAIAQAPVRELSQSNDPILRLWALYTLARSSTYNRAESRALSEAVRARDSHSQLARMLVAAMTDSRRVQLLRLDEATEWTIANHPELAALAGGLEEEAVK